MDRLKEKNEEVYEEKKSAIKYLMSDAIRGLLWSVILEQEKKTGKCIFQTHLDNIIHTIIETASYTERDDGEDYPVCDEQKIQESLDYVSDVLQEKGINPNR